MLRHPSTLSLVKEEEGNGERDRGTKKESYESEASVSVEENRCSPNVRLIFPW